MFLFRGYHWYKTWYAFDKSVVWNLNDYGFLVSLFFKMKNQNEDSCAFPMHLSVTNLLFFHSGAPLLSVHLPTSGRRQDDEEGIWA